MLQIYTIHKCRSNHEIRFGNGSSSYHLQVLPEVCVDGAVILELLQVGLRTEQEMVVKRDSFPSLERSCCTHAEAFGESFLSDEVREHPEDCSTLAAFTETEEHELRSRLQLVSFIADTVTVVACDWSTLSWSHPGRIYLVHQTQH